MQINAQTRTILGKKVRQLRKQDIMPAELYGPGVENIHLSLKYSEFKKTYETAGGNTVLQLKVDEQETVPVLISHVDEDALTNKYLTADFRQIKMDEYITLSVPIILAGSAPAVKEGHSLIHVMQELLIEALPLSIPHHIEVNIDHLNEPGQVVTVEDLKAIPNVKILSDAQAVIVSITEHKIEEIKETTPAVATETTEAAATETTPGATPEDKKV